MRKLPANLGHSGQTLTLNTSFFPISLGNSFPLLSSLRRKGSQHTKWIQFGIKLLKLPGKSFSLQLRRQGIAGPKVPRLSLAFAVLNKGHDFSSWKGG